MAKRTQITTAKSTSASKSKPQAKKKLVVESSDSEQEQTSNGSSSSSSSSSESSDDESDNNAEKSDTNLEATGRRKHGGKAATKGRAVTGGKRKRKTHISQVKSYVMFSFSYCSANVYSAHPGIASRRLAGGFPAMFIPISTYH